MARNDSDYSVYLGGEKLKLMNNFLLYLRVSIAYKSSKYTIYVYKKWRAMLARHKSSSVYSHAHLSKHTYSILPPIAIRRKADRSLD